MVLGPVVVDDVYIDACKRVSRSYSIDIITAYGSVWCVMCFIKKNVK